MHKSNESLKKAIENGKGFKPVSEKLSALSKSCVISPEYVLSLLKIELEKTEPKK